MSKEPAPRMDPAWIRGMTQRRMSRRDLFRYAGAGAGALGLSSILAACGVSGEAQTTGPTAGAEGSAEWWADLKTKGPGDHLNFTNWPAYIDRDFSVDGAGSRPSLYAFTARDGHRRHVPGRHQRQRGVLRDDPPSARERAGHRPRHHRDVQLPGAVGDDRARLSDRARPRAAAELRRERRPELQGPRATTRATSTRWPGSPASPGSATNTKYVDEPITSLDDLLNPKYAGHVGDVQTTPTRRARHARARDRPRETRRPDDWQQAADYLQQFNGLRGHPRVLRTRLHDGDRERGHCGSRWRGRATSSTTSSTVAGYATFEFVVPEAGAMILTDNMLHPHTRPRTRSAR